MSFSDERRAIETFFDTGWTGTGVSHFFEGQARNERAGSEFVVVRIRSGQGNQLYLSLDTHRYAGVVIVEIYTPLNKGTDRARDIADGVSTVLRKKTTSVANSGKIEFMTPWLSYPASTLEWYRMNVNTPYRRDVSF